MNKSKYQAGDLLFNVFERIIYLILEIVHYTEIPSHYNLFYLDKDGGLGGKYIPINYIDDNPDIYKCGTEAEIGKEMVTIFVEASKNIKSLPKKKNFD